jgi:hypothetical protein
LATVLGLLFATIAFMFLLQDIHSAWFSDVIWTGLVTGFLFWVAGACAMLTLPPPMRFNGAAAFGIPGTIAGMVFQFFYGPARFRFDLGSQPWWTNTAWEHLLLWLIAGAGGGALMGWMWKRHEERTETEKAATGNRWAWTSIACGALGLGIGGFYFLRSTLPLGLFNSCLPPRLLPIGCGAGEYSVRLLPRSPSLSRIGDGGPPRGWRWHLCWRWCLTALTAIHGNRNSIPSMHKSCFETRRPRATPFMPAI